MIGLLWSIIPSLVTFGPLALLAALFPAIFGSLAIWRQRWAVFFAVAAILTSLFLMQAWFPAWLPRFWGESPTRLWLAVLALAGSGGVLSWHRHRRFRNKAVPGKADTTPLAERWLLILLSLLGLGQWGYAWLGSEPGMESLTATAQLWMVVWVGAIYDVGQSVLLFGRPGRTRLATETVMLATLAGIGGWNAAGVRPVPPPEIEVVWSLELPEPGAIITRPAVRGSQLFVAAIHDLGLATFGRVYAVDRHSRQENWQFDDARRMQHMFSSPTLADDRLYIGEGMHANFACRLHCLDARTGEPCWSFATTSHVESTPTVVAGQVYFGAGDDGIYCLDAETGIKSWQYQQALHVDSSPSVVGGRLYASAGISRLYRTPAIVCLDAAAGTEIWRLPTELPAWGSPTVSGEQVFVGLGNGRLTQSVDRVADRAGGLLCLESSTGERCWYFPVADGVLARPAVDEKHVYFGSRDGRCYCLEREQGRLRWKHEVGSPIVASVGLAGGRVYVLGSGGLVCALDSESGHEIWRWDLARVTGMKPRLLGSPEIFEDEDQQRLLYFGAELQNPIGSTAVLYCLHDR